MSDDAYWHPSPLLSVGARVVVPSSIFASAENGNGTVVDDGSRSKPVHAVVVDLCPLLGAVQVARVSDVYRYGLPAVPEALVPTDLCQQHRHQSLSSHQCPCFPPHQHQDCAPFWLQQRRALFTCPPPPSPMIASSSCPLEEVNRQQQQYGGCDNCCSLTEIRTIRREENIAEKQRRGRLLLSNVTTASCCDDVCYGELPRVPHEFLPYSLGLAQLLGNTTAAASSDSAAAAVSPFLHGVEKKLHRGCGVRSSCRCQFVSIPIDASTTVDVVSHTVYFLLSWRLLHLESLVVLQRLRCCSPVVGRGDKRKNDVHAKKNKNKNTRSTLLAKPQQQLRMLLLVVEPSSCGGSTAVVAPLVARTLENASSLRNSTTFRRRGTTSTCCLSSWEHHEVDGLGSQHVASWTVCPWTSDVTALMAQGTDLALLIGELESSPHREEQPDDHREKRARLLRFLSSFHLICWYDATNQPTADTTISTASLVLPSAMPSVTVKVEDVMDAWAAEKAQTAGCCDADPPFYVRTSFVYTIRRNAAASCAATAVPSMEDAEHQRVRSIIFQPSEFSLLRACELIGVGRNDPIDVLLQRSRSMRSISATSMDAVAPPTDGAEQQRRKRHRQKDDIVAASSLLRWSPVHGTDHHQLPTDASSPQPRLDRDATGHDRLQSNSAGTSRRRLSLGDDHDHHVAAMEADHHAARRRSAASVFPPSLTRATDGAASSTSAIGYHECGNSSAAIEFKRRWAELALHDLFVMPVVPQLCYDDEPGSLREPSGQSHLVRLLNALRDDLTQTSTIPPTPPRLLLVRTVPWGTCMSMSPMEAARRAERNRQETLRIVLEHQRMDHGGHQQQQQRCFIPRIPLFDSPTVAASMEAIMTEANSQERTQHHHQQEKKKHSQQQHCRCISSDEWALDARVVQEWAMSLGGGVLVLTVPDRVDLFGHAAVQKRRGGSTDNAALQRSIYEPAEEEAERSIVARVLFAAMYADAVVVVEDEDFAGVRVPSEGLGRWAKGNLLPLLHTAAQSGVPFQSSLNGPLGPLLYCARSELAVKLPPISDPRALQQLIWHAVKWSVPLAAMDQQGECDVASDDDEKDENTKWWKHYDKDGSSVARLVRSQSASSVRQQCTLRDFLLLKSEGEREKES